MENFERFDLTEVTDEFVNEVLPIAEELDLTANQIKVLALLKYISRIDEKDEDGYFFVENDFIRKLCKIGSKSTLNNAFGVLIESGYIDRISSRVVGKASKYRVHLCTPQVYTEKVTDNQVVIENKVDKCTPNCTRNCTIDIDKDTDIESDLESHKDSKSDIYNILLNKINIIEEKENNIINIIKEKEKSSIENNNKKEKDTLMEERLQQQINELKEQNEILTSRLNKCAKQFKVMINTMRELQQKNNSLEEQINQLKENKTSSKVNKEETINVIVEPSAALIEQDDTDSQSTVKEALEVKKEVFQSPIEELNATFNAEAIVEEFKENYTNAEEAQAKQIELIDTFKKAGLNYYNRCELKSRLSKYIQSLELINSTEQEVKEEIPTVAMEVKPIEEEVKETIPTEDANQVQEELPQEAIKEAEEAIAIIKDDKATEGEESTFLGTFQTNEGNSSISEERFKLRYQDIKTKLYYPSLEEAKAANVNPMFLYDNEVSRCVSTFN